MQTRPIALALLLCTCLFGLLSCRTQHEINEIISPTLDTQASFKLSYRLYQDNPGYGNFEDLKPTERFRQFIRKEPDDSKDYLFEIEAPASAIDPRAVITIAKTSYQKPRDTEVLFRFFVPKTYFSSTAANPCHFGYTRQIRNCDVYGAVRSTTEYPFLPAEYEHPPLRCSFELLSNALDWKSLFNKATWHDPLSLNYPLELDSPMIKKAVSFHFECLDLYNGVLAANGFFSYNPTTEDSEFKNQNEFHPED